MTFAVHGVMDMTEQLNSYRKVNPESSSEEKKIYGFTLSLYLSEMMDVHQTYCRNNFMMYVSQIYALHITKCCMSIYLDKTGRKNKKETLK